jgi:transcriptional regulator with XRE-family HTH domain
VSRIEGLRRAKGLTQVALADRAGISGTYVQMIERGLRPSIRVQEAIAAVLGVAAGELWPPVETESEAGL